MKRNYGFIHEKLEIKVLILFLLRRLSAPISLEELKELAMCDDGISYFDFMECVTNLTKTGHLRFEDDKYSITQKGERNGALTEDSLPYSVRTYVENAALVYQSRKNRNAMIGTSHVVNHDDSCKVTLSLADGLGEIISMDMFAVSQQQAMALEKGFRKNAENVYNSLIELILS